MYIQQYAIGKPVVKIAIEGIEIYTAKDAACLLPPLPLSFLFILPRFCVAFRICSHPSHFTPIILSSFASVNDMLRWFIKSISCTPLFQA